MQGALPLTTDQAQALKGVFSGKMAKRNLALFLLGANTGFRITEILSLTLGDVLDDAGQIKDRLTVQRCNMKGKKSSRTVKFNELGRLGISPWLQELKKRGFVNRDDFVFQSFAAGNRPISRSQAWKVLTAAYRRAGITGKRGTHAMRKTFANNMYDYFLAQAANGKQVDAFRATSKALGHADINSTDKYLSFRTEQIDEAIEAVGV